MDFKDGDRVRHIGRDEIGTVKLLENGSVQVTFDKPTPSGRPSIGEYDDVWFSTHDDWLQPA